MTLDRKQKKFLFITGVALIIFTITYTLLVLLGLTPQQFERADKIVDIEKSIFEIVGEQEKVQDLNLIPQKIEIPKIGVSTTVQLPQSIDVASLDAALAKGAVYYPGSGTLQKGNMFLFGHSTNWQVVNNQAYKTFNDLDKLVKGDVINITSGGQTYVYRVTSLVRASEDDVLVEFNKGDRMLTISTCDSFGRKQDRWVVEAVFEKML